MIKILKLNKNDFSTCYDLLSNNYDDLIYFKALGWTDQQFKKQFFKNIFYGQGLYINEKLAGFIFGDIIKYKNVIDYEILLIYISKEKRKLGYATKLNKKVQLALKKKNLNKIYLEVAMNNKKAINFYLKNGYKKSGTRKKYYNFYTYKVDAYLFEKIADE